ncbi:hypothetical protein Pisl_1552 [Pyrobaculum islandicum DSM 4184]|uniref:Peptidase M20 dimerisation domain-containing protein n=1 Tax=Pyrobaculum islandicum (strain DSM 4184 / JCM 9189 / GEO3) TaxID=384616 RepID=A1RUS5_PYRIL|nr:peptidase dimerization domain-containing protein [Pyrobaculum islandicum]ABL88707.1 hypothetical protein Pisl_1552 [Pyrobaculum islandicum DSM 4184]
MEEVRLYARRAALEEAPLNPEDFWKCVGDAAELFSERDGEYCLDIGGEVRALSLCLYTAALLAVRLWNTKIEAVYTTAEHAERIVQIDLPILYVNLLTRSNANARRRILIEELNKRLETPSELSTAIKNSAEVYMRMTKAHEIGSGVIRGGSKINVVLDYAEPELDMRVPPGTSPTKIIEHLRRGLERLATVDVIDISEPNYTSPQEKIVRAVHEGIC